MKLTLANIKELKRKSDSSSTWEKITTAFQRSSRARKNKCVYLSISDVRYFTNEWYGHILIRTAKDEQDYRGGFNHYTTLEALPTKAAELLDDLPF